MADCKDILNLFKNKKNQNTNVVMHIYAGFRLKIGSIFSKLAELATVYAREIVRKKIEKENKEIFKKSRTKKIL